MRGYRNIISHIREEDWDWKSKTGHKNIQPVYPIVQKELQGCKKVSQSKTSPWDGGREVSSVVGWLSKRSQRGDGHYQTLLKLHGGSQPKASALRLFKPCNDGLKEWAGLAGVRATIQDGAGTLHTYIKNLPKVAKQSCTYDTLINVTKLWQWYEKI